MFYFFNLSTLWPICLSVFSFSLYPAILLLFILFVLLPLFTVSFLASTYFYPSTATTIYLITRTIIFSITSSTVLLLRMTMPHKKALPRISKYYYCGKLSHNVTSKFSFGSVLHCVCVFSSFTFPSLQWFSLPFISFGWLDWTHWWDEGAGGGVVYVYKKRFDVRFLMKCDKHVWMALLN